MSKKKASTPTFTTIGPTVITIGELMDATESDKTKIVNIPLKPSGCSLARLMREGKTNQPTKTPPELSDMDGLMRRVNKHYGKRLRDGGLLMAMAAVAEFKGWLIHQVRKMTIAEFNAALDEQWGGDSTVQTRTSKFFIGTAQHIHSHGRIGSSYQPSGDDTMSPSMRLVRKCGETI